VVPHQQFPGGSWHSERGSLELTTALPLCRPDLPFVRWVIWGGQNVEDKVVGCARARRCSPSKPAPTGKAPICPTLVRLLVESITSPHCKIVPRNLEPANIALNTAWIFIEASQRVRSAAWRFHLGLLPAVETWKPLRWKWGISHVEGCGGKYDWDWRRPRNPFEWFFTASATSAFAYRQNGLPVPLGDKQTEPDG
jgi:hypothetical protein